MGGLAEAVGEAGEAHLEQHEAEEGEGAVQAVLQPLPLPPNGIWEGRV